MATRLVSNAGEIKKNFAPVSGEFELTGFELPVVLLYAVKNNDVLENYTENLESLSPHSLLQQKMEGPSKRKIEP